MTVLAVVASACGSGADEQQEPAPAFGSLLTAEYGWAHSIGGDGADEGREIAVDSDGNVYITGRFTGVVDFDPDPSEQAFLTSNDAFLVEAPADSEEAVEAPAEDAEPDVEEAVEAPAEVDEPGAEVDAAAADETNVEGV